MSRRWAPAPRRTATCSPRRSAAPRKEDREFRRPRGLSPLLRRPHRHASFGPIFRFPISPRDVRVLAKWERPVSPSTRTRSATGKKTPLAVSPDFRSSKSGARSAFASGVPFSLVADDVDPLPGWASTQVDADKPIKGFHGASLRLKDPGATLSGNAYHRPRLLLRDLLPHARRRVVRDRDQQTGV